MPWQRADDATALTERKGRQLAGLGDVERPKLLRLGVLKKTHLPARRQATAVEEHSGTHATMRVRSAGTREKRAAVIAWARKPLAEVGEPNPAGPIEHDVVR